VLQGASVVESNRADLLELLDLLDQREAAAGRGVQGVAWKTVDELRKGINNSPDVPTLYHSRLHLLKLLDALDLLAAAVVPPAPEPVAPVESPAPAPPAPEPVAPVESPAPAPPDA